MNRNLKKVLVWIVILIGNFWLYTRIFWASSFTDAPEILANLYSKEICTCHFVEGFSPEWCAKEHHILYGPSSVNVNDAEGTVRVRVIWAVSEAKKDANPHFGCVRTTDDAALANR